MFRGACAGSGLDENEVFEIETLTGEVRQLQDQEEDCFLADVDYEIFWGKVKLVGYTM